MSLVGAIIGAAGTVFTPTGLILIFLAVMLGLIVGMLPGLGGVITLALLIPLTFSFDPLTAFMILIAAKGGTNFGGSISAILLNTPGSSPNAATILDGYPMTRQGRAGEALGASAVASAGGAIVGIFITVAMLSVLQEFLGLFGLPEIFWLGVWGLSIVAVVVRGNVVSGLVSALIGVLLALHGLNSATVTPRWTYGLDFMMDGFKLIPTLIGLFAVAEMIQLVSEGGRIDQDQSSDAGAIQQRIDGAKSVFVHKYVFLRSAILGTVIGMIPGVGGTTANYVAYLQAMQTADDPDSFGTGDVRGVIASEASNDGKDGGSLLPTLGFGIPGSASMAVLLGAFLLHGITVGPQIVTDNLDIVAVILMSLLVSNVLVSAVGLLIAGRLTAVTRVDVLYIAPVVLFIAFMGTFGIQNNIWNVWITLVAGIFGFLMIKMNMSRVPMVLGIVLAPIIEANFFRALQSSAGDYAIFVRSPLAILLIVLTILSPVLPYLQEYLRLFYKRVRT
jgi:putative tricarboxylic transport membrane protein